MSKTKHIARLKRSGASKLYGCSTCLSFALYLYVDIAGYLFVHYRRDESVRNKECTLSLGLIAEVILYSEGFESSKNLAQKMTQMYKLCSEQLSQQVSVFTLQSTLYMWTSSSL